VCAIFTHLVSPNSKSYSHGIRGLHIALHTQASTHQYPALKAIMLRTKVKAMSGYQTKRNFGLVPFAGFTFTLPSFEWM